MVADLTADARDSIVDVLNSDDSVDPEEGSSRRRLRFPRVPSTDVVLFGAFAFSVGLTFASSPDDPFITLRYAWNLLHGHGPVYNPGQRVNGATSPTGLALATAALVIPFGYAYLKLKLFSLIFGILTLTRARRLVQQLPLTAGGRLVAYASLGLCAPIAFASASGLETTVESFAVAGLLVELTSGRAFSHPARAVALGALAAATRPEAPLVIVALLVVAFIAERGRALLGRAVWSWGALVTECIILTTNRLYYHAWLPNTYYAKNIPLARAIHLGSHYVMSALDPAAHQVAAGGGTGALSFLDILASDVVFLGFCVGVVVALRRWRHHGYLLAVLTAQLLFVIKAGGDWMVGSRFLEPAMVSVVALTVLGLSTVARAGTAWARTSLTMPSALALIVASSLYSYAATSDPVTALAHGADDAALIQVGGYPYSAAWAAMPAFLACAPTGSTVAVTEAGYGPFRREDLSVLDLRGLTSSTIARAAHPSLKNTWGVEDPNWWQPSSAVGTVILLERPALIVTFDGGPAMALAGAYRRIGALRPGGISVDIYEETGRTCAHPLGGS